MAILRSIVVAVAEGGVIGRAGGMPWCLSTDLKRFKALTMGKPLVLGRKTFESFGSKPLPGRPHIVISRHETIVHPDVTMVRSLDEAMARADDLARQIGAQEICIVGGGEIYAQALPRVDRLLVTHVLSQVEGDTFFPPIDPQLWEAVDSLDIPAGERDSAPTRYVTYRRRNT